MTRTFFVSVSYSQIAVFDSFLENPFNTWTEEDVARGFAWRLGSVSFRTLEEGGRHRIEVIVAESVEISPHATRVVQVPFEVPTHGSTEIASIADGISISMPSGTYQLRFEYLVLAPPLEPAVRLVFAQSENPTFKVLRNEAEISARPLPLKVPRTRRLRRDTEQAYATFNISLTFGHGSGWLA